jgi:lipopolysaccharide transport system ATP-binding protein
LRMSSNLMSTVAIQANGLSKSYQIGHQRAKHVNIREALTQTALAPFRRLTGRAPAITTETFWALQDVSFEIKAGEAVAFIGRNGAGKSTLLKLLSRIMRPTRGSADIYGRVGALLEVGTGFHPELTGRENVYLNAAILGMKRAEIDRRFDEIVSFAEMERFIDTPIKHYSSGMGLRLGFAVAAHLEPEILIVDEVLAVGDAAFQKKSLGKMSDVSQEGRTVLFVSHNLAAVTQLCQRGIWLDQGRVRLDDTSANAVEAYVAHFTEQQAERTWQYPGDAPGDEHARLLAVRVLQDHAVSSVIDINQPVVIELDFLTLETITDFVTQIQLFNQHNSSVFANADWTPNTLGPGRYRKRVHIPPQFLAEGTFSIETRGYTYSPLIKMIHVPDSVVFEAVDSDHPQAVRGPNKRPWPGVVRPALHWDPPTPLP